MACTVWHTYHMGASAVKQQSLAAISVTKFLTGNLTLTGVDAFTGKA